MLIAVCVDEIGNLYVSVFFTLTNPIYVIYDVHNPYFGPYSNK